MLDLGKKGWGAAMLPSHRTLFQSTALLVLLAAVVWAADTVDPKVSVEPRAKPSANSPPAPRANIRVESTLVLIPVTVTDPYNRFVTGLEKENFKLLEDKKEQDISQFS